MTSPPNRERPAVASRTESEGRARGRGGAGEERKRRRRARRPARLRAQTTKAYICYAQYTSTACNSAPQSLNASLVQLPTYEYLPTRAPTTRPAQGQRPARCPRALPSTVTSPACPHATGPGVVVVAGVPSIRARTRTHVVAAAVPPTRPRTRPHVVAGVVASFLQPSAAAAVLLQSHTRGASTAARRVRRLDGAARP